jgi:hypothetical protein
MNTPLLALETDVICTHLERQDTHSWDLLEPLRILHLISPRQADQVLF